MFTIFFSINDPTNVFEIFLNSLSISLIEIIVWIALSLFFLISFEHLSKNKLSKFLKKNKLTNYLGNAFLGLTPGCGGAIFATSMYREKITTIGGLMIAYIVTIGDSAWILLTINFKAWFVLSSFLLIIGLVLGSIVDLFIKESYLNLKGEHEPGHGEIGKFWIKDQDELSSLKQAPYWLVFFNKYIITSFFWFFIIFALPLSISELFNFEILKSSSNGYLIFLSFGMFLLMLFQLFRFLSRFFIDLNTHHHGNKIEEEISHKHSIGEILIDVCEDSLVVAFLLVWTIFFFQILGFYIPKDALDSFFISIYWFTPLIAILLGFIPGNEIPMLLMFLYIGNVSGTALIIGGLIPFAALLGNSIMQEGHAGYLLLFKNPKSYFFLKFVKVIPALIISYLFLILEFYTNFPNDFIGIEVASKDYSTYNFNIRDNFILLNLNDIIRNNIIL